MHRFTVRLRPGSIHDVGAADAGREREAAGQCLAKTDEVGHNAAVLAGKPFSGAAKPGVNFIQNQQHAMFVAQPAQHRQKLSGWNINAAPRLHRLNQNRADSFTSQNPVDAPFDGGQVAGLRWKLNEMTKFAKLILERAAEKITVGHVERTVAEPMIRAGEGDDTVLAGGEHGGLERGFDRFKTRIAENDLAFFFAAAPAFEGEAAQCAREFGLARVGMHITHRVRETGQLPLPGLDHAQIGMTGGSHAKRRGQIQILFPIGVPNVHIPGAFPNHRPGTVGFNVNDVPRFVVAE